MAVEVMLTYEAEVEDNVSIEDVPSSAIADSVVLALSEVVVAKSLPTPFSLTDVPSQRLTLLQYQFDALSIEHQQVFT